MRKNTSILLVRLDEERDTVVFLYQPRIPVALAASDTTRPADQLVSRWPHKKRVASRRAGLSALMYEPYNVTPEEQQEYESSEEDGSGKNQPGRGVRRTQRRERQQVDDSSQCERPADAIHAAPNEMARHGHCTVCDREVVGGPESDRHRDRDRDVLESVESPNCVLRNRPSPRTETPSIFS